MTGWATGPLVAFDTETTGLDVDADRIVTAYVGDGSTRELSWLVDPGVAIPAKATAIHGITTDEARAHGRPAAGAIGEIVDALARALADGIPVVTYNAAYDFTLLDADPAHSKQVEAARAASQRAHRAADAAWLQHSPDGADVQRWERLQPQLATFPLSLLSEVTGFSLRHCSRFRAGLVIPHPRVWAALERLTELPTSGDGTDERHRVTAGGPALRFPLKPAAEDGSPGFPPKPAAVDGSPVRDGLGPPDGLLHTANRTAAQRLDPRPATPRSPAVLALSREAH